MTGRDPHVTRSRGGAKMRCFHSVIGVRIDRCPNSEMRVDMATSRRLTCIGMKN